MHIFTAIQFIILVILWIVKSTAASLSLSILVDFMYSYKEIPSSQDLHSKRIGYGNFVNVIMYIDRCNFCYLVDLSFC